MSADILVVDDEIDIRELVAGILEDEGHRTRTAGTSDDALAAIEARRPHLVFLDIWLQGSRLDGLQVLDIVKNATESIAALPEPDRGQAQIAVLLDDTHPDYVIPAVTDNGKGFPVEGRQRLL